MIFSYLFVMRYAENQNSKQIEQKEKSQFNNDALENHIKKLEAKISDMEDSVSFVEIDLRDKLSKEIKEKELLQEYATSLKSSMEAVQDVQDKYNQLVIGKKACLKKRGPVLAFK